MDVGLQEFALSAGGILEISGLKPWRHAFEILVALCLFLRLALFLSRYAQTSHQQEVDGLIFETLAQSGW